MLQTSIGIGEYGGGRLERDRKKRSSRRGGDSVKGIAVAINVMNGLLETTLNSSNISSKMRSATFLLPGYVAG